MTSDATPERHPFNSRLVTSGLSRIQAELQVGLIPPDPLRCRMVGLKMLTNYDEADDLAEVSPNERVLCLLTAGQLLTKAGTLRAAEAGAAEAMEKLGQEIDGLTPEELASVAEELAIDPEELIDPENRQGLFQYPDRTIWARRGWSS